MANEIPADPRYDPALYDKRVQALRDLFSAPADYSPVSRGIAARGAVVPDPTNPEIAAPSLQAPAPAPAPTAPALPAPVAALMADPLAQHRADAQAAMDSLNAENVDIENPKLSGLRDQPWISHSDAGRATYDLGTQGRAAVDTSRGNAGADWLASHRGTPSAPAPAVADAAGEKTYSFSGNGSRADYEGRHQAAEMRNAGLLDELQGSEIQQRIEDPDQLGAYEAKSGIDVAKRRAESGITLGEEESRRNAFIQEASKIDADTDRKLKELTSDPRFAMDPQAKQQLLTEALRASGETRKQTLLQAFGLGQALKVNSLYGGQPFR